MNRWLKGHFEPRNRDKYVGIIEDIVYRSSWERTFMSWCDATPEVIKWSSETTVIDYFDPVKNKQRKYFIDFKMSTRQPDGSNRIILVEIKPYKQTIKPRANRNKSEKTIYSEQTTWVTNTAKWNAARALCTKMGWSFVILTEKELFGGIDQGYKPARK